MQQPTPKTALFAQWIQGRLVVVDQTLTTGNVWFVGSGVSGATDSAGYGRSPEAPFAMTTRVSFVEVSPSTEIRL